jgi:hypothetical protein
VVEEEKEMSEFHYQTLDPRRAGLVQRYHTWPTLKPQDVASHTWQVIRILLAIWPEAPQDLIVYAMFHDIGEVVTGDLPYPVKAGNEVLRTAVNAIDDHACLEMGQRFMVPVADMPEILGPGGLTKTLFKLCEMIEMWEHGLHECNLGNRYAAAIVQRCWEQVMKLNTQLVEASFGDSDLLLIVTRANDYMRRRVGYEQEVYDGADHNV